MWMDKVSAFMGSPYFEVVEKGAEIDLLGIGEDFFLADREVVHHREQGHEGIGTDP